MYELWCHHQLVQLSIWGKSAGLVQAVTLWGSFETCPLIWFLKLPDLDYWLRGPI